MSFTLCRIRFVPPVLPIVLTLAGIGGSDCAAAHAASGQKRVLVVYSVRRDAQIATIADRRLPQAIEDGVKAGVDYYSEYLDSARFPRREYRAAVRALMRRKSAKYK